MPLIFEPFAAFIKKGCSTYDREWQKWRSAHKKRWLTNLQDIKVFTIERQGLPKDFVFFRALCEMHSSPLVFALNLAIVGGPATTVAGNGRHSIFQVCVLLSRVLKLDDQIIVHRVSQPTWTLPLRASA